MPLTTSHSRRKLQQDSGSQGVVVVGSHTGSRIVCYSPQLYAASPGLVGPSGLYGIKVAPCWICTDSFLSLGPGLSASCCYWVLCSPTTPCMARVILPSIKHQASSLKPRSPGPEGPRCGAPSPPARRRQQGPRVRAKPWDWAAWPCVVRRRGRMWSLYLPIA